MSGKQNTTMVAALVAAVAAVLSAGFGVVSQWRISDLDREVDLQELALEQAKLTETQRARRDSVIAAWLPGLLDKDADVRERSRSLLIVLLPEQAEGLFQQLQGTVQSLDSTDEDPETAGRAETIDAELEQATQDAQDAVEQRGDWVIVVGADDSVSSALDEVQRSRDAGFPEVEVILLDGMYRTILLGFASEDDATASLPTAQVLIRESAGVRSLGQWLEGEYAIMPNIYGLTREEGLDALEMAGFTEVKDFEVDSDSMEAGRVREVVLDDGLPAESENELVDETGILVSRMPIDTPLAVKIAR